MSKWAMLYSIIKELGGDQLAKDFLTSLINRGHFTEEQAAKFEANHADYLRRIAERS